MEPQVRRQRGGAQSSYNLPFHPSDTNVYPLLSTDGASIVVYGHEKGLSLFKIYAHGADAKTLPPEERRNGAVENDASKLPRAGPRLEKWLNIELDSPVQRIIFPPVSPHLASDGRVPHSLTSDLIIAASCTDLSIQCVSVSLAAAPDSEETRNSSQFNVTSIGGEGVHQDSIAALSLTWTANALHSGSGTNSQSLYASLDSDDPISDDSLSFLLASASTTGNGLLVVHQLSFMAHFARKSEACNIIVRQSVRLPLFGSALLFNPAVFPSPKHLSLLLTSPTCGIVKTFDLAGSIPSLKGKRDSDTSRDSVETVRALPVAASLTFFAGYAHSSQVPRRKSILDAQWTLSGRSILALLEDGKWGLWNISGLGSRVGANNAAGRLAVLGQLSAASPIKKSSKTKASDPLALMTPHTRKTRNADLFGHRIRTNTTEVPSTRLGRVTMCNSVRLRPSDDSAAILNYDGRDHFLASLRSFSQSSSAKDSSGKRGHGQHLQAVPEVHLGGEHHLGTQILAAPFYQKHIEFVGTFSQIPDLLIFTDTRLIVYTQSDTKAPIAASAQSLVIRDTLFHEDIMPARRPMEEKLLDVDGIDKTLEGMYDDERPPETSQIPEQDAIVSTLVVGRDVLESPSTQAAAKLKKLIIDRKGSKTPHNLFA